MRNSGILAIGPKLAFGTLIILLATHNVFSLQSPPADEGENTFIGKVFGLDQTKPLVEAVVMGYHFETGKIFSSAPTKDTGSFTLNGLPDGFFELAIDTGDALYVVTEVMEIRGQVRRPLNLALSPGPQPVPEETRITIHRILGRPALLARVVPDDWGQPTGKNGGATVGIVLGGAAGIGLLSLLNDSDSNVSPITP